MDMEDVLDALRKAVSPQGRTVALTDSRDNIKALVFVVDPTKFDLRSNGEIDSPYLLDSSDFDDCRWSSLPNGLDFLSEF